MCAVACPAQNFGWVISFILQQDGVKSEQQAARMCNFGRKHQRDLASMQYKLREDCLSEPQYNFHSNHYADHV